MRIAMKNLIILLIICGIFAGSAFFLGKRPSGTDSDSILENQAHQAIEAASHVVDTLAAGRDWTQAGRDILGQGREVLARLDILNNRDDDGILQGKVEKGDTLAGLLEGAGSDSPQKMVNAAARVFPLKNFRAGQPYAIYTDPASGEITRFEYEINDHKRLVVENTPRPSARIEDIEYTLVLEKAHGSIEDSLFQAVADMGEHPQLALKLVDLFGSEINFIKDLQEGDHFSVLMEKRFRDGEYRGYGRILAARFTNKGKTWEAWLFRDGEGNLNYYNSRGENLKKTLLMAPLAVTRLTSRFSHNRKHPILGVSRPHLGVDYGAPTGTPVKAVGNGEVTMAGRNGGYGNQIVLKHGSGLESMYAHLSGFARGIRPGQKVRQGQVIGYVGSTGLATGPHLDFRLRQNGNFINPVKAINPRGEPVGKGQMAAFRRVQELERAYLNGRLTPENYDHDSIVPFRAVREQTAVAKKSGKSAKKSDKSVKKAEKSTKKGSARAARRSAGLSRQQADRAARLQAGRHHRHGRADISISTRHASHQGQKRNRRG